jgi:cytochrome c oxidase subunit 1
MPSPSYFPLVLAFGLPVMGYGVIFRQWWLVGIGLLVLLTGAYGWVLEPATAEE